MPLTLLTFRISPQQREDLQKILLHLDIQQSEFLRLLLLFSYKEFLANSQNFKEKLEELKNA